MTLVLVLVGHPGLRLRLQRPVHQALGDRIRLSYRLEGLSKEETSDYIDCHLRHAGGKPAFFKPDAREALFELVLLLGLDGQQVPVSPGQLKT